MNLYLMEPSTVSMAIQGHLYHYWSDTLGRFPKVRTGRPDMVGPVKMKKQ